KDGSLRHLLKSCTRGTFDYLILWSRYNPYYLDPDPSKDARVPDSELSPEQKELQELKTVRPIKAALSSDTSSPFSDPLMSKFINMMIHDGNKILARGIMTQTLETIKRKQVEKYHKSPAAKREEIECSPHIYQILNLTLKVPIPLTDNRRRFLAMKWMITECRDNKHRRTHMYEKLSQELLAAFANEGNVVKRKYDLHKMAGANRAYAHYRWW
uniref:Mitochondrial ribosomal protein S7 n=1 Tax=Cyprinus carpio TaxID=7962 RepID=A0A8C1LNB2_CYPCA